MVDPIQQKKFNSWDFC